MVFHLAVGSFVFVATSVFFYNKKLKIAKEVTSIKKQVAAPHDELLSIIKQFQTDFPNGLDHADIAETGSIIGHYLDNAIHDTITLKNGMIFKWLDIAHFSTDGALLLPCSEKKTLIIYINDLIYELIKNEQSNLLEAV